MAARFRAPLFAASLPFAALTVTYIIHGLKKRIVWKTLLVCISFILISFWTMSPLPKGVPLIRITDLGSSLNFYYLPKISGARAKGDLDEYISIFEEFLRHEPPSISRLSSKSPPQNKSDRDIAYLYSTFHKRYANALLQAGRGKEAQIAIKRSEELERFSSM
jgi:hypothetical protein